MGLHSLLQWQCYFPSPLLRLEDVYLCFKWTVTLTDMFTWCCFWAHSLQVAAFSHPPPPLHLIILCHLLSQIFSNKYNVKMAISAIIHFFLFCSNSAVITNSKISEWQVCDFFVGHIIVHSIQPIKPVLCIEYKLDDFLYRQVYHQTFACSMQYEYNMQCNVTLSVNRRVNSKT
jgi:hypothetical protein